MEKPLPPRRLPNPLVLRRHLVLAVVAVVVVSLETLDARRWRVAAVVPLPFLTVVDAP